MYILIYTMINVEVGLLFFTVVNPRIETLGIMAGIGLLLALLWWRYVPRPRRL